MPFLPDFSRAEFIRKDPIDNPYLPLVKGTVSAFSGETADGETSEGNDYFVTSLKNDVFGVRTFVIRDTAYEDGALIEDTLDFFAQDSEGNVWYFGEIVINYEYDDDGNFIGTNNDGAWIAGENDALPGWVMPDKPYKGLSYFNEFAPGVALDETLALGRGNVTEIGLGRFFNVLKTEDTTQLEPGAREFKYYAPGIGQIRTDEGLDENGNPELVIELRDIIAVGEEVRPTNTGIHQKEDFVADGINRWVTVLGEDSELNSAVGYYTFDLATGKIGEGFILFTDSDDVAAGEAFKIKVAAGRGIGLFFIPDGAENAVDVSAFEDGGLFFENMLTGNPATLTDGMAPVVTDAAGNLLPLSIFHALGANHKANLLNPGLGLQSVRFGLENEDGVQVIGFEDRRQTETGYDGDFDDLLIAFGEKPVDPDDFASAASPPAAAFAPEAVPMAAVLTAGQAAAPRMLDPPDHLATWIP